MLDMKKVAESAQLMVSTGGDCQNLGGAAAGAKLTGAICVELEAAEVGRRAGELLVGRHHAGEPRQDHKPQPGLGIPSCPHCALT